MRYISVSSFVALKKWAPLGFVVTTIFLFIYILAQQQLRSGANDPQLSLAREVVSRLESGVPVGDILKHETRDMAVTSSPYVIIYDSQGKPLSGTGTLGGVLPSPPAGVFEYLKTNGEDRFTWQPARSRRQAVVALYFKGSDISQSYYVLAGRSLVEVEGRVAQLSWITLILWSVAMLGSFMLTRLVS